MPLMTAGIPMDDPRLVRHMLEGLVAANVALLHRAQLRGRPLPPLYRAGVRYMREAPGSESWDTIDRVMRRGYGDCEDLAAARVAELRHTGEDPNARPWIVQTGRRTLHAVVKRGDGRIEDPSKRLGMGKAPPMILGAGPPPGTVEKRIERVPGGWLVRVQPSGQRPITGIAKTSAFLPAMLAMTQKQMPKAPPAVVKKVAKKKAKRKAKSSALSFLKRVGAKAIKAAAPTVANMIVPGSGAVLSAVL